VDVKVYSNAATVSLSLAGAALPAPETPAEHIFLFRSVQLQPCENTLLATSVDAERGPSVDSVTWVLE
jgi:hypothetical protein